MLNTRLFKTYNPRRALEVASRQTSRVETTVECNKHDTCADFCGRNHMLFHIWPPCVPVCVLQPEVRTKLVSIKWAASTEFGDNFLSLCPRAHTLSRGKWHAGELLQSTRAHEQKQGKSIALIRNKRWYPEALQPCTSPHTTACNTLYST